MNQEQAFQNQQHLHLNLSFNSNQKPIFAQHKVNKHKNSTIISTNWVKYFSKCTFNHFDSTSAFPEMVFTKEISYNHIYKAGGSAITEALNKLISTNRLINLTLYHDDSGKNVARNKNGNLFSGMEIKDYLQFVHNRNVNNSKNGPSGNNISLTRGHAEYDSLLFTFVRDPIDKFLSAFYEIYRRVIHNSFGIFCLNALQSNQSTLEYENIDIDNELINAKIAYSFYVNQSVFMLLEHWIDILYQRNIAKNIEKIQNNQMLRNDFNYYYFNPHNWPNIAFLSKEMGLNFIGNLANMVNDMKILLAPYFKQNYIVGQEIDNVFDKSKSGNNNSGRHRHSKEYNQRGVAEMARIFSAFSFERKQLSDNDIFKLCHIFWVDYVCFPFQIPKQCDLDQLKYKYVSFFTLMKG